MFCEYMHKSIFCKIFIIIPSAGLVSYVGLALCQETKKRGGKLLEWKWYVFNLDCTDTPPSPDSIHLLIVECGLLLVYVKRVKG